MTTRHLAAVENTEREQDPYVELFVALFGHAPKMPKPTLRVVK